MQYKEIIMRKRIKLLCLVIITFVLCCYSLTTENLLNIMYFLMFYIFITGVLFYALIHLLALMPAKSEQDSFDKYVIKKLIEDRRYFIHVSLFLIISLVSKALSCCQQESAAILIFNLHLINFIILYCLTYRKLNQILRFEKYYYRLKNFSFLE